VKDVGERAIAVTALKHAVPYIRLYKRKTFVIKAGGALFGSVDATRSLMEQVGILHQVGIRTVVVHGGGPQSTTLAVALGVETRLVEGRRVTDERSLDVATMVLNGTINTRLLAACRDVGVPAVGLSGVDAGLIRARKRPPVGVRGDANGPAVLVDYGFVGDIVSVDVDVLRRLLDEGLVPVVSPLSADEKGTLLNINADTVAAAIAVGLEAEKLVLLTGAPGILERAGDATSLVSYIDLAGLERMKGSGALSDGMLPKAAAIEQAIGGGVPRVHVISHDVPDSLLFEVFSNEGAGTLVVRSIDSLTPEEQAAADDPDPAAGGGAR
jgi:acetylglutamate kinase